MESAPISLHEPLGHGAYGTVYRATVGDVHVAAKTISFKRPLLRTEVGRESGIMASLSHRNIVGFFGTRFGAMEGTILLELCDRGSLRAYIKTMKSTKSVLRGVCDPEFISACMKGALNGLAHMHDKLFVHRDIKSDNLLIGNDNQIKISDFGLTKCIKKGEKATGEVIFRTLRGACGTRCWSAPEVLAEVEYGRKCDVWSMGIVCLEMISGAPPHYDLDRDDVTDAVVYQPAPSIESIEEAPGQYDDYYWELDQFLYYALAKDPFERMSARALGRISSIAHAPDHLPVSEDYMPLSFKTSSDQSSSSASSSDDSASAVLCQAISKCSFSPQPEQDNGPLPPPKSNSTHEQQLNESSSSSCDSESDFLAQAIRNFGARSSSSDSGSDQVVPTTPTTTSLPSGSSFQSQQMAPSPSSSSHVPSAGLPEIKGSTSSNTKSSSSSPSFAEAVASCDYQLPAGLEIIRISPSSLVAPSGYARSAHSPVRSQLPCSLPAIDNLANSPLSSASAAFAQAPFYSRTYRQHGNGKRRNHRRGRPTTTIISSTGPSAPPIVIWSPASPHRLSFPSRFGSSWRRSTSSSSDRFASPSTPRYDYSGLPRDIMPDPRFLSPMSARGN